MLALAWLLWPSISSIFDSNWSLDIWARVVGGEFPGRVPTGLVRPFYPLHELMLWDVLYAKARSCTVTKPKTKQKTTLALLVNV